MIYSVLTPVSRGQARPDVHCERKHKVGETRRYPRDVPVLRRRLRRGLWAGERDAEDRGRRVERRRATSLRRVGGMGEGPGVCVVGSEHCYISMTMDLISMSLSSPTDDWRPHANVQFPSWLPVLHFESKRWLVGLMMSAIPLRDRALAGVGKCSVAVETNKQMHLTTLLLA